MDSGYQQEPIDGGRVRFTVTPASAPGTGTGPIAAVAIFALLVLASTPPKASALQLITRFAMASVGGWWVHRLTMRWFTARLDRIRSPGGTFVVSPSCIEAAGAHIGRAQLKRLIVCHGVWGKAHARESRGANRKRVRAISYMLCAELHDRSTTLAGGMTEETTRGLLSDVSRILRFEGTVADRCSSIPAAGGEPGHHGTRTYPPAIAPTIRSGSSPNATA